MSDQMREMSNDDFEKVDPEPFQDENVTSTSMTGDMAEEDRYAEETTAQNDVDLLGGGSEHITTDFSDPKGTPLISFDQTPEPSAPPLPGEFSVPGAKTDSGEGNWVNNVDPRDEPLVEDMTEHIEAQTADSTEHLAQSEAIFSPYTGEENTNISNKQLEKLNNQERDISDTDSVASESSDCSSSGEESDSEQSETEPSDIDTSDTAFQTSVSGNNETFKNLEENSALDVSETLYQKTWNDTIGEVSSGASLREQMEFTSDAAKTHSGIHEDQEKDILNRVPVESDPISYCTSIDTETCYSNMQAGFESKDKNGVMDSEDCSNLQTVKTGLSCEYDESSWLMREEADGGKECDETTSVQESQLPILDSVEDKPVCSKDEYRLETLDIGEHHGSSMKATDQTDGLPSSLGRGISEAELSDVLDKLINEQDIIENISPIVSDFEKETEGNGEEYQKESSNSPREMSDDSDSGSEDICSSIDSDISGDEEVCGTWNPSPLYSYDVENSDEGEEVEAYTSAMGKKNETLSETENEDMNQALVMSETDDESKTSDNDKKAVAQRENVNEMMDELDSLVKQGQIDEAVETPTIQVDTSDIEAVCTVATIQSSFKSDKSKKVFSDNDDNEIHHVHFHSPTNMLFYDPESPIIERVSAEVQNELIDYDDEAKDVENEKEISGLVSKTELQAEVVKDLKEVYEKLEAEDEPSDTHEKSDAEAKVTSKLNDQSSDEKEVDISNFSLYKRKLDTEVEEEQVVLRKKNNRNSDASVHRSKILSENECDSMIINELEMVISPNTESSVISQEMEFSQSNTEHESMPGYSDQVAETESDENADMKSSTESMIIHDDDDNRLEESYSKGTNDLKSFLIDNSTSSLDNLVLSTDEKLELNTETKVTDTSQLSSTGDFEQLKGKNEFTGNLSEENNQGIEEKYLSNPESEDIAEVSPFDMSQNDTIVEAKTENYESQNLTHEISDSSDYIPKNSCLESKKIKSMMDESRTIISSGSKLNTNESLYKNEDVHTDIKTPKGKEKATQQEEFMEMIQQFLIQVLELIYWKDVKKTGVVFGSMMFILLSLSICSLMSVLAYLSLAVLTVTLSFRVYKSVMQAVQKTNEGHPFKPLLQMDIELREDVVQNAADKIAKNINNCVKELRRLYLVDDYIDSLKFGLLLWLLTYVGAWFDGMTLVILAVISIFTLPKVYETYKVPIDQNVNLIRANLNNIMAQISAKIPLIKKKAKTQ